MVERVLLLPDPQDARLSVDGQVPHLECPILLLAPLVEVVLELRLRGHVAMDEPDEAAPSNTSSSGRTEESSVSELDQGPSRQKMPSFFGAMLTGRWSQNRPAAPGSTVRQTWRGWRCHRGGGPA